LSPKRCLKIRLKAVKRGLMENSVPAAQKIPTKHHPEGIDPEQMFFDETWVHDLILSYQRQRSAA
jgi:hypothetical protein